MSAKLKTIKKHNFEVGDEVIYFGLSLVIAWSESLLVRLNKDGQGYTYTHVSLLKKVKSQTK